MACLCLAGTGAQAQGYRLRLDSRVQRASYRGVTADSILATQAVTGPTGGFETPDGFAVRCSTSSAYCFYFRPGPELDGAAPWSPPPISPSGGLAFAG